MHTDAFLRYLIKWTLLVFVVTTLIIMIFSENRVIVVIGAAAGTGLGIFKLKVLAGMLGVALIGRSYPVKASLPRYLLGQIISIVLLVSSAAYSRWLFFGVAAGMLIVPFIIAVYCIAKGVGLG